MLLPKVLIPLPDFHLSSVSRSGAVPRPPVFSHHSAASHFPVVFRSPAVALLPAVFRFPVRSLFPAVFRTLAVSRPPAVSHSSALSPAVSRPPAAFRFPAVSRFPATLRPPVVSRSSAVFRPAAVSYPPARPRPPAGNLQYSLSLDLPNHKIHHLCSRNTRQKSAAENCSDPTGKLFCLLMSKSKHNILFFFALLLQKTFIKHPELLRIFRHNSQIFNCFPTQHIRKRVEKEIRIHITGVCIKHIVRIYFHHLFVAGTAQKPRSGRICPVFDRIRFDMIKPILPQHSGKKRSRFFRLKSLPAFPGQCIKFPKSFDNIFFQVPLLYQQY